jgi:hypothetical protein
MPQLKTPVEITRFLYLWISTGTHRFLEFLRMAIGLIFPLMKGISVDWHTKYQKMQVCF